MEAATTLTAVPQPGPEEFNLHGFVREFVQRSDEPDVGALAEAIADALPEYALRAALRRSLRAYVGSVISSPRRSAGRAALTSTRWEGVQEARQSGALGLLRMRVVVGDEWKFLEECSRADVEDVAAASKKRALEQAQQAQRFVALARTMEQLDAEVVADVPIDRLVAIFHA